MRRDNLPKALRSLVAQCLTHYCFAPMRHAILLADVLKARAAAFKMEQGKFFAHVVRLNMR